MMMVMMMMMIIKIIIIIIILFGLAVKVLTCITAAPGSSSNSRYLFHRLKSFVLFDVVIKLRHA